MVRVWLPDSPTCTVRLFGSTVSAASRNTEPNTSTVGNRAEPLVAIYPKGTGTDFITALSGSDFSLQSLTKKLVDAGKLSLVNVLEEEGKLFRNFNNLSDFD